MELKKVLMIFYLFTAVFFLSFTFFLISRHDNNKKIVKIQNEVDTIKGKKTLFETKIKELSQKKELMEKTEALIKDTSKVFYYYDNINKFVNDFTLLIKKQKVEISKIEYSKIENQKRLKIVIPFFGTYEEIRNFIYDIEKTFFFLKITGMSLSKSEKKLRGSMEILVYFGEKSNE